MLIICSPALPRQGKWFFGPGVTSQPNYKVVPNGIDVSKYSFNPLVRKEVKNEFQINNSIVLGHVGNFVEQKNHAFLVSVFKKVNEIRPETVLLLVGEGMLMKRITQKIDRNGLSDRVIMTGARRDVNRLLQAMDVFIFPSLSEGFGNAVTEAQVAGLPCIVSDKVPHEVGITDLVEFVALDQGAEVWADKIISKFKNFERKNMSAEIAKAGYDIKPIAKWYENFYLANSAPSAPIKVDSYDFI
jgi:glycosyltransferase involved in cell wall biosynthesis